MKAAIAALVIMVLSTAPAAAQMAITTFGATDAQTCYKDASDGFVSDTGSCDAALKGVTLTKRDRLATYVNRGIILNRARRPADAIEDFNEALEGDATLAEAYLNRGNSFYLLGRFDDAIGDYRASLDNGLPKEHVAWYNIGLAYEAKKDAVAARAAYRTALELNPDFGPALRKMNPETPQTD